MECERKSVEGERVESPPCVCMEGCITVRPINHSQDPGAEYTNQPLTIRKIYIPQSLLHLLICSDHSIVFVYANSQKTVFPTSSQQVLQKLTETSVEVC